MSDAKDDRELEEYLGGRSSLSRRYREASREEPPAHLDDAILAASRRAVQAGPRPARTLIPTRWVKPLSIAAVVVLSTTLVITVRDELREQMTTPAAATGQDAAAMALEQARKTTRIQLQSRAERALEDEAHVETKRMEKPALRAAPDISRPASEPVQLSPPETPAAPELEFPLPASADIEFEPAREARERSPRLAEEAGQAEAAAALAIRPPPALLLRQIAARWNEGRLEEARVALRGFLEDYPGYPREELQRILPEALYTEFNDGR